MRCSSARNRVELSQLRQYVDHAPGLSDTAVDEAEDKYLVVLDGFSGWLDTHVFTALGPSNDISADHLVILRDQVLHRDVKVGVGSMKPQKHLLQRTRTREANRQWSADQSVGFDDL